MKERVFWMGHKGLGDCFTVCAAGSIYGRETGKPTVISFWDHFAGLADYFDHIQYIRPQINDGYRLSPKQLEQYEMIDIGSEPNPPYKFNMTSWRLRFMQGFDSDADPVMNIGRYPIRDIVSVVTVSHTNGPLNPQTLRTMLQRAKVFYPNHQYLYVGHRHNDPQNEAILREFGVQDARTPDDKTVHVLIEQLRRSDLLISPHCGIVHPALALGLRVWCEASRKEFWDYWLDYPKNRPFWFRRP